MELFVARHMNKPVIDLLTSNDIKTIYDFLSNDESAVFIRKSNAGNLIFRNSQGEVTYRLKDHQFLAPLKTSSLLSAAEAIALSQTLMLKKYPYITKFEIIKDDDISIMPMARYVKLTPLIIAAGGISKNALCHKINTIKREIRDDFPDTAIKDINELVNDLLIKYKVQRHKFSLSDDSAAQAFMPSSQRQMLQVFLEKELTRDDLKKCKKTYQISQTDEVISPAENPPLSQIVKHLEKSLQRFLDIQKNGPKYLEAQHYLTRIGAEQVVLNKDFSMTASFGDFGTIRIKPLEPYKRKTKAWLKEEKAKIMAIEKETEQKLLASPLFGRIIPYEMLWLIRHSEHELTSSAICRIMRSQSGVSDWYRDAETAFREHCHSDMLYSMITEEDLKKYLHVLYDAHLLSTRLVHGEYTCFDVYSLTQEGESFVSLMQKKGFNKGEYATLKKLIRQTDVKDIKSQLKTFSYLIDHIPLIGADPSFMISCVQTCVNRALEYLDLQLALSDDENHKKSLRKIKKMINENIKRQASH